MTKAQGPSRQRVEAALQQISDLGVESTRIFITIDRERAKRDADAVDKRLAAGERLPLAGLVCSIKDLVDRRGERTTAGSRLLERREVAATDAEILSRLEAAGAVILGRTNLSEFAYSGVGLNPHHGTPGCIFDKTLVPGGSSSGAALSVAHGICDIAIGTDTGGSVRVPAAVNGIHGIKPTTGLVPTTGVHPLSSLMDSVGPLSNDWATTRLAFEVLSGTAFDAPASSSLVLGVPQGAFTGDLDNAIADAFDNNLNVLRKAGVELVDIDLEWMTGVAVANRTLVSCEAHEQYGPDLKELAKVGDPHILERIRFAEDVAPAARAAAHTLRVESVSRFTGALESAGVSAILSPTVPIDTPSKDDAKADFGRLNAALLRNTSLINFVDGCSVSLPTASTGAVPGAMMVSAASGQDQRLISVVDALVPLLG